VPHPAGNADEKTMLLGYLDMYRDVIAWKVEDLPDDQARRTSTSMSLLNLIVHLTGVEKSWFESVIAGNAVDRDRNSEFREVDTSVAEAVENYRAQCQRSNEIMSGVASLDEPCKGEPGYSVRWVLLHLLEETARHAGHADITRELVDGKTGFARDDAG
jgi:uncharacterized damage-inducible protein DinB